MTFDNLYWKPSFTRRLQTLVTFDNYIENLILPDGYRHLWHLTTILKTLYYQTCTDTCDIWQLYWKPYITRRLQTLVTFDNYIENLILADVYRHLWHLTTILKTLHYQTSTDTCDIWHLYWKPYISRRLQTLVTFDNYSWKPYITRRLQTLVTFDNYIENLLLPDVYRHLWHLTTILKTLYYQTSTDTCDIWQLYWKSYITRRLQTLVTFDNYIENLILPDVYRHLWHLTIYWKPYISRRLQTLVTFDIYIENIILPDVYRHLWHLTTILKTLYYQTCTDTCDIWQLYWKPYITRRVQTLVTFDNLYWKPYISRRVQTLVTFDNYIENPICTRRLQTLVTFDNYIENLILADVYRHLWHLTTILKTLYYQTGTDTCDIWQLYWKPYISRRLQTLVTFDNYIENLILPDVYRHLWHLTTILKTVFYIENLILADVYSHLWHLTTILKTLY